MPTVGRKLILCIYTVIIYLSILTYVPLKCICICVHCACVLQSEAVTSVSATTSEWPSITKLPAKFSHKWKNRTSLTSTDVAQSSAAVTTQTATKGRLGASDSALLLTLCALQITILLLLLLLYAAFALAY